MIPLAVHVALRGAAAPQSRCCSAFALIVIIGVDLWTVTAVRPRLPRPRRTDDADGDADEFFTWVFLVPALNEEVTIADSVERLLAVPVRRRHVVVIDDASDDRTPEILARARPPRPARVRRELPAARIGKAAGLNHAYSELGERLGRKTARG